MSFSDAVANYKRTASIEPVMIRKLAARMYDSFSNTVLGLHLRKKKFWKMTSRMGGWKHSRRISSHLSTFYQTWIPR
ncbi:hypothetical protein BUE80_DR013856, partial [Diplocarpon rosae]